MIIEQKYQKEQEHKIFYYDRYSFAIQIKRSSDETTPFCSEMHKVLQKFLQGKLWQDNTSLQNIYQISK